MPCRTTATNAPHRPSSWLFALFTTVALVGCAAGSADDVPGGPEALLVSTTASRAAPYALEGATLRGDAYVFANVAPSDAARVAFYLTSGTDDTELLRVADVAPFDLVGVEGESGRPWDTRALQDGRLRLEAEIVRPDGSVDVLSAEFQIANVTISTDRWQPRPGTSWQWQLTGSIDTTVDADVFDLDLHVDQAVIDDLRERGRKVICYFSAGTVEPWRPDADAYPSALIGAKMAGWDEYWLDVRRLDLLAPILRARLDLAVEKGCDAVEPDNVAGYQHQTGFPLSYDDQLGFNRFLAVEAHARGLSIGLKNDLEQIHDLIDDFDFAVNEECYQWNECHRLTPFVAAGKAVFGAEYGVPTSEFCPVTNALDLDFILKGLYLDAWRESCR